MQSHAIARYAKNLRFTVEDGPSATVRFPASGPYDMRLGYAGLGGYIKALTGNGYEVTRQAQPTPELAKFVERIGYAPYREKSSGGLGVFDRQWRPIFAKRYPERLYSDFETVPRVIVDTLLFIENRELLDEANPNRNPSVEWDRFAAAAVGVVARTINPETKIFGGSTLATQLEKFRHSPDGRTSDPLEKLRQIASGSVRAYLDGPNTLAARERIVVDYLNSTPLGARNGHGEVHGVGDGLYVWYGVSFAEANRILQAPAEDEETLAKKALVYKQAMSLLLAQRRPAYYFANPKALETLANSYLRLMAAQGVIDEELRDAALHTPLVQGSEPAPGANTFLERKAANAVRNHMLTLMQVPSLYALDRIDVEARSVRRAGAGDGDRPAPPARRPRLPAGQRHGRRAPHGQGRSGPRRLQRHAHGARRERQLCAHPGRQPRPAARSQRRREAGSRLDRQAAHAHHLSRDLRRAAWPLRAVDAGGIGGGRERGQRRAHEVDSALLRRHNR